MKKVFIALAAITSLFVLLVIWVNITPGSFDYYEPGNCQVVYTSTHWRQPGVDYGLESNCDRFIIPPTLINLSRFDFNK